MWSRRKRKRYRALRANNAFGPRGDRLRNPLPKGSGVPCADIWADASRTDLQLLRRAIREHWPVPIERFVQIMESVMSILYRPHTIKMFFALSRVAFAADRERVRPYLGL